MKLTTLLLLTIALKTAMAGRRHGHFPCGYGYKRSRPWKNISVSSSGTTEMKNGSGGASITENKNVDNLLLKNHHTGSQINHFKKVANSRVIGKDVTSIETSGNNEIDIGGAALLKKSHGHGHGHGHYYGHGHHHHGHLHGYYPYYGGSYGVSHKASAKAKAWSNGRGAGARASAKAHSRYHSRFHGHHGHHHPVVFIGDNQ